jgi:hypothetical protein
MANSNLFSVIKEMYGRITKEVSFLGRGLNYKLYGDEPSVDYSKTDYTLTRAIFYASVIKKDNKEYGKEFLLGASFGKPIVNTASALAFSRDPEIYVNHTSIVGGSVQQSIAEGTLEYNKDLLDNWLAKYSSEVFKTARNTLRDGDQYILINKDLTPTIIPPEQVEIVEDKLTGEVIGFDVTFIVEDDEDEPTNHKNTIKYLAEYRKTYPFYTLKKFDKNKDDTFKIIKGGEQEGDEEIEDERPLPIVAFHNEADARERYGSSEYQNLYYLFANYHAVLASAIKGNLYDTAPATFFKGIDNWDTWIRANGVYNEVTKEYELRWDKDKVFAGGDGFSIETVQGGDGADKAKTILELLFKLIVQTSETPEFVFGTAVKSSKASVSEQMPVALVKAKRKQKEFAKFYEKLFLTVLQIAEQNGWAKVDSNVDVIIKWPEIMQDDLTLNLEIVRFLSEQGLITDRVKMLLLNMSAKVDDIDKELEEANEEYDKKMENTAMNLPFPPSSPQAKQKPEEELEDNE